MSRGDLGVEKDLNAQGIYHVSLSLLICDAKICVYEVGDARI